MSKLDSQLSKKAANELAEEIDTLGQEDETKASKWVMEVQNKEDKEERDITNDEATLLTDKRKYKKNAYYESLYQMAKRRLSDFEIPAGYNVDCILKNDGRLIVGLQKVGFRWYAKGMKICGDPHYDMNCLERLVVQAMMSLDELYGHHEKLMTKDGIKIPERIIV